MKPTRNELRALAEEKQRAYGPYLFDAALLGPQVRPRLYWTTFVPAQDRVACRIHGQRPERFVKVTNPHVLSISADTVLDAGVTKCGNGPFPTAVRWIPRASPQDQARGLEDCDPETIENWKASEYAMAPYHVKKESGVVMAKGRYRPPNADERERLHGFKQLNTQGFPEHRSISFVGNTFPLRCGSVSPRGFLLMTKATCRGCPP